MYGGQTRPRTSVSDTKRRKWADQESNKNLWKIAVGEDDDDDDDGEPEGGRPGR